MCCYKEKEEGEEVEGRAGGKRKEGRRGGGKKTRFRMEKCEGFVCKINMRGERNEGGKENKEEREDKDI